MNKRFFVLICCTFIVFLALNILISKQSAAQTANFRNVIPFTTPAGYLCFFDQNTGMIYVYDQQSQPAIIISQVDQLGAPLKNLMPVPEDQKGGKP